MVGKCANSWCPTPRHPRHRHEGKLFRLDINLGTMAGGDERRTEYIWLCDRCAREMHPKVEVNGDTIKVLLSRNDPMRGGDIGASSARIN
jgi:hypothetical protein